MKKCVRQFAVILAMIFMAPVSVRAEDGQKQIALTFDDGPSVHTERLLDFLEEEGIHATFFLVGDRIGNYREIVRRQVLEGHEIGYHSYSHADQTLLSSKRIYEDFCRSNRELFELTGREYTLWRAPGGSFNQRVLDAVPLPHIHWSADTRDWETKNAAAVCSSILKSAGDGVIILLHDLYGTSVDGAIGAIQSLQKQGYEFVTVSELLSRNGEKPQNCMNYFK